MCQSISSPLSPPDRILSSSYQRQVTKLGDGPPRLLLPKKINVLVKFLERSGTERPPIKNKRLPLVIRLFCHIQRRFKEGIVGVFQLFASISLPIPNLRGVQTKINEKPLYPIKIHVFMMTSSLYFITKQSN